MTNGKKAASDIPKNHRIAKMPLKFVAAEPRRVREPKQNIKILNTRAGPKRFPNIAIGGAKITYGRKKMESNMLYCESLKCKSVPLVSAQPLLKLKMGR